MTGSLFSSILAVVVLIAVGYFAKKTGLLSVDDRNPINNIIIYVTMPALVFRSVLQSDLDVSFLKIPVVAVGVMLVSLGFAYLLGRLLSLNRPVFGSFLLVSAIGNTGYLGYPLTMTLFGRENLVRAIFFDIFGSVLFVFTVGLAIAKKYGDRGSDFSIARELFAFPPLLGLVAAFFARSFSLPAFADSAIAFLADATVPLIMLSIGLSIEFDKIFEDPKRLVAASLVKLMIAPAAALVGAWALGFSRVDMGITVLEASMPAMMFSLIIGLKYGLDVEFLPASIVGTTFLSLLTVPAWQYVIRAI